MSVRMVDVMGDCFYPPNKFGGYRMVDVSRITSIIPDVKYGAGAVTCSFKGRSNIFNHHIYYSRHTGINSDRHHI